MRLQVTTQAHDKFATFTVEDASTGEVLLPLIEAEVMLVVRLALSHVTHMRFGWSVQDGFQ